MSAAAPIFWNISARRIVPTVETVTSVALPKIKLPVRWTRQHDLRLYEKALKMLEPDPTMMHNIYGSRAMSFHKAEDYRTAIRYYELSYRYHKKNISALSSIGYCYERLKEYDKALEYYEQYLKLGKPGTKGYRYVEESIAYIKQEKFMENPE